MDIVRVRLTEVGVTKQQADAPLPVALPNQPLESVSRADRSAAAHTHAARHPKRRSRSPTRRAARPTACQRVGRVQPSGPCGVHRVRALSASSWA